MMCLHIPGNVFDPAEQYFQLCGNRMELDKSSKQAGRQAGGSLVSNTAVAAGSTVAAGSNSVTNDRSYFRLSTLVDYA